MGLETHPGHPLLDHTQANGIVTDALALEPLDGRRVLLIVPDHTRTAPVDLMFRLIYEALAPRVEALDVMMKIAIISELVRMRKKSIRTKH